MADPTGTHDARDRLRSGLADLCPEHVTEHRISRLARYLEDLYQSSRIFGLISAEDAVDRSTLVVRHLLDSAAGAETVANIVREEGTRVICDLGSGAGLPGIPLTVLLEDLLEACYLVERREKRVRFLQLATGNLELSQLRILQTDAERPSRDAQEIFRANPPSVVVFRAYQQTSPALMKALLRRFPVGTSFVAWKGRRAVVEEEAALISGTSGLTVRAVTPLTVPFLERERTLLVFKRIA